MSIETLKALLPEYAKDLKLNLSTLAAEPSLSEQQRAGTFIACALASRNKTTTNAIFTEFAPKLSAEALTAVRAAAAIMGMNNIFYRFRHLSTNEKYGSMPARLRMQVIRGHGSDPVDFELWCLAVSAINGCGVCVDSHEKVLHEKGVGEETILAAVRIASVVHALAAVMDAITA